jgi:nitroimidazol reductase NimA-like FMN-containing flavoprotein (pyridoxamine 5'-phosphate oxidase superfamily)
VTAESTVSRHEAHGQPPPAGLVPLSAERALELLAGVSLGRVVFSHQALPAVRPVQHVVDDGAVIFRSRSGAMIVGPAGSGSVVAYQADRIDEDRHTGWSVVVTGTASLVSDPDELARYGRLLAPWSPAGADHVVRISADIVTGFRIAH